MRIKMVRGKQVWSVYEFSKSKIPAKVLRLELSTWTRNRNLRFTETSAKSVKQSQQQDTPLAGKRNQFPHQLKSLPSEETTSSISSNLTYQRSIKQTTQCPLVAQFGTSVIMHLPRLTRIKLFQQCPKTTSRESQLLFRP